MFARRSVPGAIALALVLAARAGNAAELKPLTVAIGLSLPPYVMADQRRGMEYDIVKEALADAGYEMKPVFVSFGELPQAVVDGTAEAAMTVGEDTPGVALSDIAIVYHNEAMTLASRRLKIDSIADLKGHSILAFQSATLYLPAAFVTAIAGNSRYHEVAQQYRQDVALFAGKVDVVVADVNIFNWYRKDPRVTAVADTSQAVDDHDIFPPTPYRVGFRDPAVRDAFNVALAALRSSGRYQQIVARYGGSD